MSLPKQGRNALPGSCGRCVKAQAPRSRGQDTRNRLQLGSSGTREPGCGHEGSHPTACVRGRASAQGWLGGLRHPGSRPRQPLSGLPQGAVTRWVAGGPHFAVLYYFPWHQAFPGPTLTPDPQLQPVYRPNCWPPSSCVEALTPSATVSEDGAWWGLVKANVGSEAGPLIPEDTCPPRKRKPRQARV